MKFSKATKKDSMEMLAHYIRMIDAGCSDYAEVKLTYEKACRELKAKFAHTDKIIEYTNDILAASLVFSYELGMKHGSEYVSNILEDYDATIREKELKESPDYIEAYNNLQKVVALIPAEVRSLYDDCLEHFAFMETFIPKLAHYYGFILGNEVHREEKSDYELPNKYKYWLSDYLNMKLE